MAGVAVLVGAVSLTSSASTLGPEESWLDATRAVDALAAPALPSAPTPSRFATVSRSAQRSEGDQAGAAEATRAGVGTAVDRQATRRARALAALGRQARSYARELASERWALPLTRYRITGTFGETSYLWSTVHTGLDFASPTGTDIHAVASGKVIEAGWAGSYGYRTIVELEDGTELWYCHQSSIAVGVGDVVARGQVIGAVGSTGNVTGPHLHLEVRPAGGDPVDPAVALAEHEAAP